MAIQLTQAGDAVANNVIAGTNFIPVAATSPLSITCWISAPWTTNAVHSYVGLYSEIGRSTGGQITAVQLGQKGANTFNVWTWGGGVLVDSTIDMSVYNNQWCFLAYTFDGTTHRAYVNGALGGSANSVQQPGVLDRVYINGYTNGGASETATFQVDTYNSYARALTQDEIITMYNTRGNKHGIVFSRIVAYEFDEISLGSAVTQVPNLTAFDGAYSNLIPVVPAGSTRVTYTNGYADANLRTPHG